MRSRLTVGSAAAATAIALLPAGVYAHDPITTKLTWSKEISRLFLKRCMNCHQNGGPAPFALTTYEEARPWAVAIRDEVSGRTMPPWGAVKGFGDFRDDPSLSQEEISLIIDWVNGGAPEGDKQFAPADAPKAYVPLGAAGRAVRLTGSRTLAEATRLIGIRPRSVPPRTEAQLIAYLPDGSTEPLVWIRNWNSKFPHDFVLREPLDLPAATRVDVSASSMAASGPPLSFDLLVESPRRRAAAQKKKPATP